MTMELRSTRRIVTGHDDKGKAVVLFDKRSRPSSAAITA
jgi:hypothetical protein